MSAPLLYTTYCALSAVLLPFAARREVNKIRNAGMPVLRAHEKLGHASDNRAGSGPLVWFHAASVGESLSVLALITMMGQMQPRAQFLITSGTPTSADLIARRMPPRTVHQFAPLDAKGPLNRFLAHWRPNAAVFVESELWPQMLRRTYDSGAKLALVNARLSAGSRRNWARVPKTARYLLDVFSLILTQNDDMAQAMVDMNAPPDRVARGFNLKSLSDPLPIDATTLTDMRKVLGQRPVWVAASTHPGEEEIVLAAHQILLKSHPDLALILAPRHPERGDAVADLIRATGLSVAQRSAGTPPTAQVYLADTLGELGTWYALAPVVFLGGSLKPIGGHNPFEVAAAGRPVLSGPHVTNFAETFDDMIQSGAATFTADADSLAEAVHHMLDDPDALNAASQAAERFAAQKQGQLAQIAGRLIKALELEDG